MTIAEKRKEYRLINILFKTIYKKKSAKWRGDYLRKKHIFHHIGENVHLWGGIPSDPYLARLLVDMNETEKYGYYHATNEGGYISWYDFTKEIYRQAGYKTEVLPVSTEEYGLSKAARPFNSRLDKSKLVEAGFTPLPTWQDALSRYLKEIEQ